MADGTTSRYTRRDFIKAGAAAAVGIGALALPRFPAALKAGIQQEWRNRQPEMFYRQLGRTGMMISEFVQGGNFVAPDNHQHVEYAIERGLNYLDTARAYGRGASEKGYAKVISGLKREKVFVTSKVSLFKDHKNGLFKEIYDELSDSEKKRIDHAIQEMIEERQLTEPEYLISPYVGKMKQIEASFSASVMDTKYGNRFDKRKEYYQLIIDSVHTSLKNLRTDYLDIIICPHGATATEELDIHEIHEAFEILKRAGKVRFLGVSAHNDPAGLVRKAGQTGRYDMAMVAYNVVNGAWVTPAIHEATRNGLGVIGMKVARAVHPGRPHWKPEPHRSRKLDRIIPGPLKIPMKAYLWALQDPNIAAVNSEILNIKMAEENLSLAGRKVVLQPEQG